MPLEPRVARSRLNACAACLVAYSLLVPTLVAAAAAAERKHAATSQTQRLAVARFAALESVLAWKPQPRAAYRSAEPAKATTIAARTPPLVGVIDSGVDLTHPGLSTHLWTNPGEIAGNGRDDDGDGIVDDVHGANLLTRTGDVSDEGGHGTHVAGIVGATDPSASIMALKAGTGEWIDLRAATAAVYYAVAHGVRILNLSWAFLHDDPAFDQAIRFASTHGVLVVAAAGNFGTSNDARPVFPATSASGGVVSVAATCDGRSLAPFSDYGKLTVALAAPGCEVTSTLPGGGYGSLSGTSMAAPAVAGAAARLLEKLPTATPRELERALLGGATPQGALGDTVASGAVLSAAGAEAALASPDLAAPTAPERLSPAPTFATQRDPSYYFARVDFSWTPSHDLDLAGYRLIVDGVPVAATGPGATALTVKVPPGTHSWTVVAYDRSGNEASA